MTEANPTPLEPPAGPEVWFYHLERSSLMDALPKLLEKTLETGARAVVKAGSPERVDALVGDLWSYDAASWLPHGSAKDGRAADQPIWLTDNDVNPNGASFLFLCDGAEAPADLIKNYARCFDLFDGRNMEAVKAARGRWKVISGAGLTPAYWRQSDEGRWQRQET